MPKTVAVLSFPGNNCEVESIRALKASGLKPLFFRWNDDVSKLEGVDGYFIPGGFSYEDRGRAGMVAARDPLLEYLGKEAEAGKAIIGNCNGAQVLVESGLVPLGKELSMSLARNVANGTAVGFINEWVWVTPNCAKDRCATSNWDGPMHIPLAHGEGRFTTRDKDLVEDLKQNNQLAFQYCNEQGEVSEELHTTPNGSVYAVAGICNPAGNVVALMPHPERTPNGKPYFDSLRLWLENSPGTNYSSPSATHSTSPVQERAPQGTEIFIDTIITNNEEHTVEQAAKRYVPNLSLKQLRYYSVDDEKQILNNISLFNPNKHTAYIRKNGTVSVWDTDTKSSSATTNILEGTTVFLRRDEPDTVAASHKTIKESGICYACQGVGGSELMQPAVLEVFYNPHASSLERLV